MNAIRKSLSIASSKIEQALQSIKHEMRVYSDLGKDFMDIVDAYSDLNQQCLNIERGMEKFKELNVTQINSSG